MRHEKVDSNSINLNRFSFEITPIRTLLAKNIYTKTKFT